MPHALQAVALRPLWEAVHTRMSSGRAVTRVRIGPLNHNQRAAVADLLGLDRTPGEHYTVSIPALETALAEAGTDIPTVVTTLIGPIGDRAAERVRAEARRAELWDWLDTHPEVRRQPALASWAQQVRRAGLVNGSVGQTRDILATVLAVLARLPAEGQPLPAVASEVTGDPHALDDGTRLGNLVLRALATIFGAPMPATAYERRVLWEQAGVAADELSSVVLAAGLRLNGHGVASDLARCCAEAGQAVALTLAQLRATELHAAPEQVWVVENPSIIAMALREFGTDCPPMVCTSGWPNTAVVLLLRGMADLGARLHYHGDFDGEGLRIAAYAMEKTGARPWRMATGDYLRGLRPSTQGPEPGRITEAPWDADLADTVREIGQALAEESVADDLLTDLARHVVSG
ncbi:TIGR02679 family protein [Saccharomonospora xinjiangensis]|uniref:TIGR02679 family protein n=1 Tax=Saccharomonospora xinjiangensis XJ-54 TaxID=882086 RepID=I0UWT4_9PSEU|nr:TIGR02679 family protein [Saccharomonospora xinjiangensis]EID52337.1 TIGR02679 family protein [Saccharomonospora xinjiangensis XJ-54]